MGKYKNSRSQNIISVTIVVIIVGLSTLYAMSALFPSLFQ
jgi:Mn2+/Fe2+ NRAMP family transporter